MPRPACPRPARLAAVAAVAGAMAFGMLAPAVAQSPLPEPVLVVGGETTDGQVSLRPATQAVADPRVTWLLTNGGTDSLTFELSVHDVTTRDGDVEIGDARADLPLARPTVQLAPGEVARIPVRLPDTTPGTLALIASSVDAEPETTVSGIVLVGADEQVTPRVVGADGAAGAFTVRLDADAPALVDVAVQTSVWPGIMVREDVVDSVLVPAGGRDLDITLEGAIAGRVHVDVAVSGQPPARATADLWWWPVEAVVLALAVIVVVVVVAVWLVRRRRRSSPALA